MENVIITKKPVSFKTWHLFVILLLVAWLNTWIFQNHIMTREVYYNLYSEQLEIRRIDNLIKFFQIFSIWSYITAPLILWIQITFITLLIQFPLILKIIDIPFKQIFRIVTFAFIPLTVMMLVRSLWLLRFEPDQINEYTLTFIPLALTNLINVTSYPKAVLGLLGNINIFSLIYCVIIYNGLFSTGKLKKDDAALLVFAIMTLLLVFQWALVSYLTKIGS
ncbi:hypothetical protein JW824_14225 [bacterium]|nr:hypothetical protein [bacterium]